MRSTLLSRLLAGTLTIAVAAVLATAWLASQTTRERVQGEFAHALEGDGFIYGQLTSHAASHPDWRAAGPLLAELAQRTGRHIALGDPGSPDLLAVGPSGERIDGGAVPDDPVAVIDAFAPLLDVAPTRLGPLELGGVPTALSELSPDRRDELRRWAVDTGACLVARGFEADVQLTSDGQSVGGAAIDDEATAPGSAGDPGLNGDPGEQGTPQEPRDGPDGRAWPRVFIDERTPWSVITDCDALPMDRQDEEELRLRDAIGDGVRGCLAEEGIAHADELVPRTSEGPYLRVVPLPEDGPQEEVATSCEQTALRDVLGAYVAAPAPLYLWDDGDGSLLDRVGGGRLLLAVALVLLVAAGAAIVSGRRLVLPIQALTGAAERLAAGDRSTRSELDRRDEIGRLAVAFDTMAASLEDEERRRQLMVTDVAHELRNPLTNVIGHLDAAAEGVIPLDQELLRSLQEESALLERLIDDLQQLALAEAGQLRLEVDLLDASAIARQVVASHAGRAKALGVTLVADTSGPAPVEADPARLRQVLGNLIDNAIRHTPDGGRIEVACGADGATIELTVTDTGSGIDPTHLPHVFDRFYRADASRSRHTGGSGIGLALVRAITDAHGGTVTATSEPGVGSTFTLRLPAADRPDSTDHGG